jgi:hypothetical protein
MAKGENAPWASAATGVLQALLHAAALSGATIDRLHEWTSSPSRAAEAAEVLKGAGSVEGWEELIRSVLEDDPRILGSKFFGVTEAFRALDTATTRQTFDTSGGATDLEELLLSGGTLYMLSRWRDESGGEVTVGGLQALLLDDLVDTARRISQRDGSRLDPPVTLVLDEVANCFQWARLPQVMAAGSGEGVKALVVFQSRAQAKASYGAESEKTMWDNANRLLLGGSASVDDLKDLSLLAGEREQHRRSHSSSGGWLDNRGQSWSDQVHDKPVLGVDDLSRLPDRVDAMLAKGARLILVDLEPWQERPWAHLVPPQDQWDTLAKEGLFR